MKPHILPIIPAGLLLAILSGGSVAAPVLPAGRPKEAISFQAHPYDIETLACSPDGKILATGGRDGKLKLWTMPDGKNIAEIQAHTQAKRGFGILTGLAFYPDGKTLLTCDDTGNVKVWDVATRHNTDTLDTRLLGPLQFSPDGKTLVSRHQLLDMRTRKTRKLMENPGQWPVAAFTPKGELLVGTSVPYYPDPASFTVWNVSTGKKIFTRTSNRRVFACRAFSPDGKIVVSSEGDYDTRKWVIRLWDIARGENTITHEQPEIPCKPTFSPNGNVLAVSCSLAADRNDYPGSVRLIEVSSGKVLANLKGYKRTVNCMGFSPDGRLLVTASLDGVIKIWSLPKRYKDE